TNNFEAILYKSLTEIANGRHAGQATVLRLCRSSGFKGYQDFKLSLARELPSHQKSDQHATYSTKVKHNLVRTEEDTCASADDEQLQQSIQMIYQAKDVVVYGVSSSGIAGLDMQNRLMRIGRNIEVVTDSHNQMIRSNSVDNQTVIIAISLTGSTKAI